MKPPSERFIKTITSMTLDNLRKLDGWIHELIEYHETGSPGGRNIQVTNEKKVSTGIYRQEKVDCGKPTCSKCKGVPSHGPYWFHYTYKSGKLVRKYIGKELPANTAESHPQ